MKTAILLQICSPPTGAAGLPGAKYLKISMYYLESAPRELLEVLNIMANVKTLWDWENADNDIKGEILALGEEVLDLWVNGII